MRWKTTAVMVGGILFGMGCLGGGQRALETRVATDLHDIQQQADQVLAFIDGNRDTPPILDSDPETDAKFWEATAFPERRETLQDLKRQGCLGENNRGQLELRDCAAFADPEAENDAQKLLAQENKERKALYKEMAHQKREEKIPVADVESIFLLKRLSRAHSGEAFQLPSAGDHFDAFKETALGKKLGAECVPEAWITAP